MIFRQTIAIRFLTHIHAGFIIEKLNEEEARLIDEAWDEYAKTNAE